MLFSRNAISAYIKKDFLESFNIRFAQLVYCIFNQVITGVDNGNKDCGKLKEVV